MKGARILSIIFIIWSFLIFISAMLLVLPFILICSALIKGKKGEDIIFYFLNIWGLIFCILCFFLVRTRNKMSIQPGKAYIYVCNHNSYLDAVAIVLAIPGSFKPLGKIEMANVPIFGIIHAKARGAKIYAELVGGGMSADANHITAPHPEGLGAKLVMTNALRDAELQPSDIDYINVHGTSTPLGDISEVKAIVDLFKEHAFKLNISSTKSMTGHLLGAAGAVEAIAAILAVKNDIVPPTINHFTDDPGFDPKLNFTFNKAQKRTVNAALSNTFGFGGHNASVIFKKYTA